ncbi:HpcH/HpaI aldolase/citrate lyase family protein [Pelotomaculum propionicicum]|uniref:Citrate lyase subunit beta n=1 Tax=Pelotomaculum propionicicum TaxID=258475 RepID=A0A4Y7RUJ3_9FIRM|nr:CoA ester lyase [Pelotomaculum propionicicum]NLI14344.1 CoA ester lyase [Peptococcaceae bacterium]TEB12551.1 Citrate lyase subunit beta [Pelotomaculum propionicicum]
MSIYRTMLFAPANDLRKVGKALLLNADGTVLDLEDAVALSEKANARNALKEALALPRKGDVFIRVNSAQTDFILTDLLAAVTEGVKGLVLAKSESAEEIRQVDWLMEKIEKERGIPAGSMELIPFIESANAIVNAYAIASACPRVSRMFFGGVDYVLDIGTTFSKGGEEIFHARSQLVVASRAAGIEPPIDTVYPDFKNIEGLVADAKTVRQMGFQGKLAIHPGQIEPLNEVFTPTAEEMAWAKKIVDVFDEQEARGQAVFQVDGKMIEYPIANRARRIIALAEQIAQKNG